MSIQQYEVWVFLCLSGVKKGDRVAIYLPMIPELVFIMLACARIGAVHSIVVRVHQNCSHVQQILQSKHYCRSTLSLFLALVLSACLE